MAKKRGPLRVILFSFITLFIYAIYWYYQAFKQSLSDSGGNHVIWFILLFIPIVNFFVLWKFTGWVSEYSDGRHSSVLLFVLLIFLWPVGVYLIQSDLNAGYEDRN